MAGRSVVNKTKTGNRRKLSPQAAKLLPYPDFPLSPHLPTGRWYKVINQKRVYFGAIAGGADAAFEKYQRQRDDLYAGRTPRDTCADTYTIRDLANGYMSAQKRKLDAGDLQQRTFDEYMETCRLITETFGRERAVGDLAADDFAPLRTKLVAAYSTVRLGVMIQQVRGVFKWAWDNGHLDRPVRFGQALDKPTARAVRQARNAQPAKLFAPADIRAILAVANPQLRAMVLLAINCGYGNTDCAELPLSAVDLEVGQINYPRPKTGVQRRCPLWLETTKAIKAVIDGRCDPQDEADAGRVFLTSRGTPCLRYASGARLDMVGRWFGEAKKAAGVNGEGRGFYALRHSFETIAGETGDQAGVDFIMGHAPRSGDMSAVYREWAGDDREAARLRRVTDHVRAWLFPPAPKAKRTTKKRATRKAGA